MSGNKPLASVQYEVEDLDDAIEVCFRKGWTDGLPVVPPTEEKVRRFLEAGRREPGEVLGFYTEGRRRVTVEKVAINAVMAGCLPEYFRVVLAIVEAMLGGDFSIHGANSSTAGMAVGFIVNGPIRNELEMNYQGNVLGPGNRANSTIGRALRLVQINVLGAVSGAGGRDKLGRTMVDRATMGQPGKYTGYHLVEYEEAFPSLLPLHVELGFPQESSVVTVFLFPGHLQLFVHADSTGDQIVDTIAQYVVGTGRLVSQGFCVIILSPEKAEFLVRDGWSKADVRNALFERTTRTVARLKQQGWCGGSLMDARGGPVLPGDEEETRAIATRPENIYLVVAGGPGGGWVDFFLPMRSQPQSRVIRA